MRSTSIAIHNYGRQSGLSEQHKDLRTQNVTVS